MTVQLTGKRKQYVGAVSAAIFGLGLLVVGGRLIAYEHVLAEPAVAPGLIVASGRTQSSRGVTTAFIRYEFVDPLGRTQAGTSSGYSGKPGEYILIEYSPRLPSIHRVAGEGKTGGYKWRWPIAGFGLLLFVAGAHWWWGIPRAFGSPRRSEH